MTPDSTFFDEMAPQWDNITEVIPSKISHILDVAAISRGDSVLDVGTGTGVLIPYLSERVGEAGRIDAVDLSEGMLTQARRKFGHIPNVTFHRLDIENENVGERYDHIIMYCMYPHLSEPYDTVEWLVKLNLRPEGNLVIAHPEGRQSINAIHHHNDGSVHSSHLIEANLMRARLSLKGLNVDYVEDTPDYYIIRITV